MARRDGLHIVFITRLDLPEGNGGTSRLKSLVTALSGDGHEILILNEYALGISPFQLQQPIGEICGAPFEYVLGSVDRKYGLRTCVSKCKAVLAVAKRLKALWEARIVDIVWFANLSLYDTYPLTLLCRRLGIRTIQEYVDERFELVTKERISFARRLFAYNSYLADRWCPAMADAIIVISTYLMKKYALLAKDSSKIHLIPTIIDCARWQTGPEATTDVPTILYSGCLGEQDEMENVITALARLRDHGQRFRFVMLGGNLRKGESDREQRIRAQIANLQLGDMIEQRGFVPLEEVRAELAKSNVLLNIRRDGVWSRSGLSTKLSEYLASGRLVVSSDVGDVSNYIQDNDSALLVSGKCTVDEITRGLGRALSLPDVRARIGRRGREVALRWFDVPVAQKRLRTVLRAIMPDSAELWGPTLAKEEG